MEKYTVLAVDDVKFNLLAAKRILEPEGMEVLMAQSGEEALQALQTNPLIDIVISDLHMPELDGVELLEHAQRLKYATDSGLMGPPPFILLTSSQDQERLLAASKAGFQDIMAKPLNLERFRQALRQIFKKDKRPRSQRGGGGGEIEGVAAEQEKKQKLCDIIIPEVQEIINRQDREAAGKLMLQVEKARKLLDVFLKKGRD